MTTDAQAIVCTALRKRYRTTEALAGIDLRVGRGSVFGLLGPNGAGKSTLVKILTGLVRATSGDARVVDGTPGSRAVNRRIGYLPEHFRFPYWLTGRELLRAHARLARVDADDDSLLELVGLSDAGDRRIGEYSKGMQQRLGLAQALVGDPDVVFLDEPTSALDPLGRLDVRDVLVRLRERGMTVFLNSHLLTEVERVCDHLAVIDRGRVIARGTTEDLLQSPGLRVTVGDLPAATLERLAHGWPPAMAPPAYSDGTLTVPGASRDDVPDIVRAVVSVGIPVYEVTVVRQTLEDAFVTLLRGAGPSAADGDGSEKPSTDGGETDADAGAPESATP